MSYAFTSDLAYPSAQRALPQIHVAHSIFLRTVAKVYSSQRASSDEPPSTSPFPITHPAARTAVQPAVLTLFLYFSNICFSL